MNLRRRSLMRKPQSESFLFWDFSGGYDGFTAYAGTTKIQDNNLMPVSFSGSSVLSPAWTASSVSKTETAKTIVGDFEISMQNLISNSPYSVYGRCGIALLSGGNVILKLFFLDNWDDSDVEANLEVNGTKIAANKKSATSRANIAVARVGSTYNLKVSGVTVASASGYNGTITFDTIVLEVGSSYTGLTPSYNNTIRSYSITGGNIV